MKKLFTQMAFAAIVAVAPAAGLAVDPPDVDLTRAQEIHMARCFMCHGENGESSTPLYPRLAGQHYQYTAKQLEAFLTGKR
ncbi:c-type cytochrome, partial [Arthrospira platensis SPKY1]|nr:c-type cytochrome [Arthrospira platensis SPKY1]